MLSSKLKMAAVLAGLLLAPALSYAQGPGGGRGGFGGGFGRGGFGGNSLSGLLRMEEVQKEISVTDEQKAALDKAAEERRAARGQGGGVNFQELQNLSEEERTKRMEEFRKTMEEASKKADEQVKSLLKPEQVARLNQLLIQREGIAALNRADVQKELGLSEEQVTKLKAATEARNAGGGGFGGGRNFQEMSEDELRKLREEREARTKKYNDDMNAVLTADQKAAFEKMQGAKFTFPAGGGFGGPGGGGRGGRGGPGGGAGGGRPRPE